MPYLPFQIVVDPCSGAAFKRLRRRLDPWCAKADATSVLRHLCNARRQRSTKFTVVEPAITVSLPICFDFSELCR